MRAVVLLCRDCGASHAWRSDFGPECTRLIAVYLDSIALRQDRKTTEANGIELKEAE